MCDVNTLTSGYEKQSENASINKLSSLYMLTLLLALKFACHLTKKKTISLVKNWKYQ